MVVKFKKFIVPSQTNKQKGGLFKGSASICSDKVEKKSVYALHVARADNHLIEMKNIYKESISKTERLPDRDPDHRFCYHYFHVAEIGDIVIFTLSSPFQSQSSSSTVSASASQLLLSSFYLYTKVSCFTFLSYCMRFLCLFSSTHFIFFVVVGLKNACLL